MPIRDQLERFAADNGLQICRTLRRVFSSPSSHLLYEVHASRQKLDALLARHAALERDFAAALPAETYVKLSRELAELTPVIEAVKAYRAAQRELDGMTSLIDDPATDAEMRAIAEAEKRELEARRTALEQQLRVALLPKDAMDERNVILEIRAGTGGDEAALFAGDLFRMYERYAAKQGWKVES